MPRLIAAALAALALSGCADGPATNSFYAQNSAAGKEHRVVVYSGGKAVAEYRSDGDPHKTSNGTAFYFRNKATGKFVEVLGTVVIEEL